MGYRDRISGKSLKYIHMSLIEIANAITKKLNTLICQASWEPLRIFTACQHANWTAFLTGFLQGYFYCITCTEICNRNCQLALITNY